MHVDEMKARLHGALHRHPKASEEKTKRLPP